MMMRRPCPSGSRLLTPFFKFKKFVYNGKITSGHFSIINQFFKPKNRLQQPGARRKRGWHHHGGDTPTSPRSILLHTVQFFYSFLHTTCKIGNSQKEVGIKKIKEFDPIYDMSQYILKCQRFFQSSSTGNI